MLPAADSYHYLKEKVRENFKDSQVLIISSNAAP